MKINDIKTLMIDVGHISNHYREIVKITGGEFNVFKTLGLQSSEVRLHSAILTDLLNPLGSHGQGDLFLKIFVRQQRITGFDTKSAIAEYEKNTGFINSDYTKGGRIDILITDKYNKHIIIENKIYAGDQKNQLLRYYNFDKNAYLFYLNLFGAKPSEFSANTLISESQYSIISYSYDIIEWLEECKRNAVSLPFIRETIGQYINLLKQLTNQATEEKMKDEIKKAITNNPDYIDSIELCSQVIQSTVNETKTQFMSMFESLFPSQIIYSDNDVSIKIHWGEDGDGIYFGYQAFKGEENISNSDIALQYGEIFRNIDSDIHSSPWNFAWFNPIPVKRYQRFEHLDKKEIFKMNSNTDYLKSFIEGLIQKENDIRKEFLNRFGKKK
jgi:hypothetical protein